MWKNVVILSIACALAFGTISTAQDKIPVKDEFQKRLDRNRDGFIDEKEQQLLQEFEQAKERIEKLRLMAREAEEKARNFMAEAEEIQRNIEREFEMPPMPQPKEQVHARIAELKEAAKLAEQEGQHDRAAQLREKVMVLTRELEARDREVQDVKHVELKEKLIHLEELAREAKERGEMDKAERLLAEAKELKAAAGGLKPPKEKQESAERINPMHAELAELKKAAQRAEREGRPDEAAELREKAQNIAKEIGQAGGKGKIRVAEGEIERLHVLAAEAKEAGQLDKAESLLREANALKGRLKGAPELKKQPPIQPELMHQIELLREEVARLRKDVEELKQLTHQQR
jgi:fused signal recognition particle receptor